MHRRCPGWLLLAGLLFVAGCGDGIRRTEVKGKVTFAGKPIEQGEIRFIPLRTDVGPVAGASIVNGAYECTGKNAVPVGKCKVEIEAYRTPRGYKQDPNVPFEQKEQYIPEKYNRLTTLEYEVPDKGPAQKDFDLKR